MTFSGPFEILVDLLLLAFSLAAGALSNLTSGGAGVLTILVLTGYTGLTIQQAIATVLASSTVTVFAGAVAFQRNRQVDGWLSLTTGVSGVAGAFLAARLALGTPPSDLERAFGLFMLFLGAYTLVDYYRTRGRSPTASATLNTAQSRLAGRDPLGVVLQVLLGSLIGVATGLFGVGGGSLTIAVLLFLFKLPTTKVLGTGLMASLFRYLGATAGYIGSAAISPFFFAILTIGGVVGSVVGAKVIVARKGSGGYVKLILVVLFLFTALQFLSKSI